MAQRKMIERHHAAHPGLAHAPKIPDNSEPWLPHLPQSLAECMWISDQVAKEVEKWGPKSQPTERLPVGAAAEARELLERFLDPEVLTFALENPDAEVRAMALTHLSEFEAEGDPYSRDALAGWRAKNPAQ